MNAHADPARTDRPTVARAVLVSRVIWGGLTLGLLVLVVVAAALTPGGDPVEPAQRRAGDTLAIVSGGLLVTLVPVCLFARGEVFKSAWVGEMITPGAFVRGNAIAWASVAATGACSTVAAVLAGMVLPHAIVGVLSCVLLMLMSPTDAAMRSPERDRE